MGNTQKVKTLIREKLNEKAIARDYMAKQSGLKHPLTSETWLGCVVDSLINASITDRNVNAAKLLFAYYGDEESEVKL